MTAPFTISVIGPGKVGQTLSRRIAQTPDLAVGDILGRRPEGAQAACDFAGAGRAVSGFADLRPADLWLLTVPDDQIAGVAQRLAQSGLAPAIVAHCSGFYPSGLLAALADLGWQAASAHPVLSFADPATSASQFDGCYCGVEGPASEPLTKVFTALGATCFGLRTDAKALYHAAAVISNNFTTVLQALAQEAWTEAGVPRDVMGDLHAALLRGTVDNVLAKGAQAALTGPAARGDTTVVAAQGAAVAEWKAEAGAVYHLLSAMAVRLKSDGQV